MNRYITAKEMYAKIESNWHRISSKISSTQPNTPHANDIR